MKPSENNSIRVHTAVLVAALVTVVGLYLARDLLVVLALATLVSFFLTPAVRWVERARLGRVLSVVLVVGLGAAILTSVGWFVAIQTASVAREVPKYSDNIVTKVRHVRNSVSGIGKLATRAEQRLKEETVPDPTMELTGADPPSGPADVPVDAPVKVEVVPRWLDPMKLVVEVVPSLVHLLTAIGVTAFLSIFFLVFREDLRDRVLRLCGRARIQITTTALSDMADRLTRFLVVQVLVNTCNGALVAVGLLLIGVPNALLWGLLGAILRFIPFIGLWIAGILPVALSIAVFEGWGAPVLVIAWLLSVDLVSANVLEPWLYGARTGASPVAVLASLVFWTWLWGAIGLLLATPITVCLVVLGKYVPQLEVLYILLSDRPALDPHVRFYQRLIARDRVEVMAIVKRAAAEKAPAEILDELVFPALAEIEMDRPAGGVDEETRKFAAQIVEDLVDELILGKETDPVPEGAPPRVLLLPDQGRFDETVARVLAKLCRSTGIAAEGLSRHLLLTEALDQIREARPRTVVLTALHPSKPRRIAYLCRRIAEVLDSAETLVGPWVESGRQPNWTKEVDMQPCTRVHTSLAQALLALPRESHLEPAPVSMPQQQLAATS